MPLNAELIIAMTGLIAASFAAWNSYRTSQSTARKDEVSLLRDEVARLSKRVDELSRANAQLQDENMALHRQITKLQAENILLRSTLQQHGITIPLLPEPATAGISTEFKSYPE